MDLIREMKWLSKNGLTSKKKAEEHGECFASYVNLGGSSYLHYVSVFEPKVSCYNRLGRIMVLYNAKNNTWHGPHANGTFLK